MSYYRGFLSCRMTYEALQLSCGQLLDIRKPCFSSTKTSSWAVQRMP